ncbi:MAG: PAS domain S-box protein [Erysipelothrix sp.]|nr:PAS domain S-box protein [Erysipelothrix sp.]
MDNEVIFGLIMNTGLLFVLLVFYQLKNYFQPKFDKMAPIIKGIILGIMGILVMSYPLVLDGGLMIDARSVLISSVALFVPLTALLISSSMMMIYTIYLGGIGLYFGALIIVISTLIGILWRRYVLDKLDISRWLNIYLYALLIHGSIIASLTILPENLVNLANATLSIPLIALFPITTIIVSAFFLNEKTFEESNALIDQTDQKYSQLYNHPHTILLVIDPKDGQIIDANPGALEFYGWSKKTLLDKKLSDICNSSLQQIQEDLDQASQMIKRQWLSQHVKANGEVSDIEVFCHPLIIDRKPLLNMIVVEVSGKSVIKTKIKQDFDLFKTVVDNSLDAIYIQIGRRFVYLNPAALRLFKVQDESQMIGMLILDRIHPDYHQEVNHIMLQSNHDRKALNSSQWVYLTMNNVPVTVESVIVPIVYNGQRGTLVITHDITTRLETLSALMSSEMNFRSVVKNIPIPILIHQNEKVVFLNRAAQEFLGASNDLDLLGLPFKKFVPENNGDGIWGYIKKEVNQKLDAAIDKQAFLRVDGQSVFAQVKAVPINYDGVKSDLIFARDLTEELEMEKRKLEWEMQIQQKQRLESIGVLAGGIAHEINNPINGIMNYAQLIVDEAQQDDVIDDYVSQILKESQRISDIVKNLLQFSRHEKHAYSYSSIIDIIDNTLSLIKVIFKNDQIDLHLTIEEGLPDIKCRSQQIQQVFMNLMTNARDALNEKYPGYHEKKIIEVDVSMKYKDDHRWIYLCVKDYGMGIKDEVKARLFEPFFSTKPKHIGTGLGLAISFGIVENHHGKILIDSVVGEHSIFTVVLPVDNGWELLPERRLNDDSYIDRG